MPTQTERQGDTQWWQRPEAARPPGRGQPSGGVSVRHVPSHRVFVGLRDVRARYLLRRAAVSSLLCLVAHITQLRTFCSTPKPRPLPVCRQDRYNFDSFTPDSCGCVGCCCFSFGNLRGKRPVPLTKSGVARFNTLVALRAKVLPYRSALAHERADASRSVRRAGS